MKRPGDPLVRQQSDQFLLNIAEEELLSLETEIIRLNEKNESLQAVIESKQQVINKWIDNMDRLMEFSENRNSDDEEELDEATLNDTMSLAKIIKYKFNSRADSLTTDLNLRIKSDLEKNKIWVKTID